MAKPRANLISVSISRQAFKFLEQLSQADRMRIDKGIDQIRETPLIGKVLAGMKDLRRLRVGNFRIIYSFQKKELRILVVMIGHRKEIYDKI